MTHWALPLLLLWFAGTGAGTALGILLVRGGAMKPNPFPEFAEPDERQEAA